MKRPIVMTPIENYHLRQLEIYDYITNHEGVKGKLVDIINKAGTSFSYSFLNECDSLLNKTDIAESRLIKRTVVTVSIGKTANHRRYGNIFYAYLSSVLVNPHIVFRNLNTTDEPSIDIFDKQYRTSLVTSIYLDSISNVSVESMIATDADFEEHIITYHSNLNNLDYRITIVIDK